MKLNWILMKSNELDRLCLRLRWKTVGKVASSSFIIICPRYLVLWFEIQLQLAAPRPKRPSSLVSAQLKFQDQFSLDFSTINNKFPHTLSCDDSIFVLFDYGSLSLMEFNFCECIRCISMKSKLTQWGNLLMQIVLFSCWRFVSIYAISSIESSKLIELIYES